MKLCEIHANMYLHDSLDMLNGFSLVNNHRMLLFVQILLLYFTSALKLEFFCLLLFIFLLNNKICVTGCRRDSAKFRGWAGADSEPVTIGRRASVGVRVCRPGQRCQGPREPRHHYRPWSGPHVSKASSHCKFILHLQFFLNSQI